MNLHRICQAVIFATFIQYMCINYKYVNDSINLIRSVTTLLALANSLALIHNVQGRNIMNWRLMWEQRVL